MGPLLVPGSSLVTSAASAGSSIVRWPSTVVVGRSGARADHAHAASVLIGFGLMQLFSALAYGIPMPVQPLKAVAALVIAGGIAERADRLPNGIDLGVQAGVPFCDSRVVRA